MKTYSKLKATEPNRTEPNDFISDEDFVCSISRHWSVNATELYGKLLEVEGWQ